MSTLADTNGNLEPIKAADQAHGSAGAASSSSQKLSLNRVPTLTFPPLHLGSFSDFDASSFPSPPVPVSASTSSTASASMPASAMASASTSGLKPSSSNNTLGRPSSRGSMNTNTTTVDARPQPSISEGSNSRTLRPASRESRESTRSRGSVSLSVRSRQLSGPTSAPPTGALPPLPTSPERSPESAGTFGAAQAAALAHITGNFASQVSLDRRSTTPLGSAPPSATAEPVLRDSPIPRRRTLIQPQAAEVQGKERQVSMVLDDVPLVPSPRAEQFPLPASVMNGAAGKEEQEHKLEKRPSTNNLRASPTSPKKRSLPRPPSEVLGQVQNQPKPTLEIVTALPSSMPVPPMAMQSVRGMQVQPIPPRQATDQQQPAARAAAPSASTLPIIAGLADAGPYSFTKPTAPPGMSGGVGLGRPSQPQVRQEEVCLECMMRDQDLADIDVLSPGVWGRASDAGLDELKWREEGLLASLSGSQRLDLSTSTRDMGTSDEESSGPSPPSTTNSLEEAEARRKEASRQRREVAKAKKREADYRVAREIGWRGFKWEEGTAGEGLPRGFRGTKPGRLTEEGIKQVMIKFPSASALRYNNLQNYLRNQYLLVMDVAAEATRIGYFPQPPELGYDEDRQERLSQPGPAHTAPTGIPFQSTTPLTTTPLRGSSVGVRPSPSSPADLSAIAGRPISGAVRNNAGAMVRPTTHYIPDREPRPADSTLRPTLTSLSTSPAQYINDLDYSPISPADSGVRPFSFAVRAGATGHGMGGESEGQNGRRSFFGRWGGSVTSFFGGSQGGSGSMMDMQYVYNTCDDAGVELTSSIGLDSERRNRTSSFNVHSQPRAVSLASPTRPSFFSRDSRDSTRVAAEAAARPSRDMDRNARNRGQSLSASRLSQVMRSDDPEADLTPEPVHAPVPMPETPKKKGLRGLIKRMRGKSVSAKTPPAMSYEQFKPDDFTGQSYPRPPMQPRQDSAVSSAQQLAPPPPLSYLVGRGEKHARTRSGSSSSMMTDTSGAPGQPQHQQQQQQQPRLSQGQYGANGNRSVSAPLADTSSGDQSASPTSSKFDRGRDSYGSRRQVRYSREEMNGVGNGGGNVDFAAPMPSHHSQAIHSYGAGAGAGAGSGAGPGMANGVGMPHNASYRSGNKTASSMSASSVVETPPPIHMPLTFPAQHPSDGGAGKHYNGGTNGPLLSPNRFKNLPPLPADSGSSGRPSPNLDDAQVYSSHQQQQQQQYDTVRSSTVRTARSSNNNLPQPLYQPVHPHSHPHSQSRPAPERASTFQEQARARASYDTGETRRVHLQQQMYSGRRQPQQRMAQSMYMQNTPSANARGQGHGHGHVPNGYGYDHPEQQGYDGYGNEQYAGDGGEMGAGSTLKGKEKRKGLKGLFGGSKAGRLA